MKIVFEIPSHDLKQVEYIRQVATSKCATAHNMGFAIAMNGIDKAKVIEETDFIAMPVRTYIKKPCVSMVELRQSANIVASYKWPESKYRIIADHNFKFGIGWENFIIEAIDDMERFIKITGKECYLGMMGAFGNSGHGRQTFMGPQPIFPMGRGIIYTGNPWRVMEQLPSSLEEQYMTTLLYKDGHIPLRKFMSPISHKMNLDDGNGIHDYDLINKYNMQIVRGIWKDYGWYLTKRYGYKEKLPGVYYYANCPKNAMRDWKQKRKEIIKNYGPSEFII